MLFTIVISPSVILNVLVSFVLSLQTLSNHSLLFLKFDFILKHKLTICLLLHSPLSLFFRLEGLDLLFLNKLILSLSIDLFLLLWCKTFEMIRNISVFSMLTLSSSRVFSHQITVIHISNFKLILSLLVIFPRLLALSFFSGKSFIFLL